MQCDPCDPGGGRRAPSPGVAGPRVDGAGSVGGHSVGVVTGTTAAEGVGWGRGLRKEGSSAQAQGLKLLGSH